MIDLRLKDEESGEVENIPPAVLQSLLSATASLKNDGELMEDGKVRQLVEEEFEIDPEPGFVLKTRLPDGKKVFINICHSLHVPKAPLITDEELELLIASTTKANPEMEKLSSKFKVPMSISEIKYDKDKGGTQCIVFDTCVNSNAYERFQKSEKALVFLMELALSFVSTKHPNLDLFSENYNVPKMKVKGKLSKHKIKRAKQPFIGESATPHSKAEKGLSVAEKIEQMKREKIIEDLKREQDERARVDRLKKEILEKSVFLDESREDLTSLPKPPSLKLEKKVRKGQPSSLVIRIELIDMESAADCIVEIEPEKFLFLVPKKYFVAIPLPMAVNTKTSKAIFNRSDRILCVTLPTL